MPNQLLQLALPVNEPTLDYAPGSPERAALKSRLSSLKASPIEIPLFIGGKEVHTGTTAENHAPHCHDLRLATYHQAGPEQVALAVAAAKKAHPAWARLPWEARAAIFLKAADLLAGPWRQDLNAATMLGQSKNAFQAEIDAACELVDYLRFNAHFMLDLYRHQPWSPRAAWNRMEYRPLEGFVFAITPFNFTSIIGNLPTAPALMGNTVVWKPASPAIYSAHFLMRLLTAAGLPDGVINMIPGPGPAIGEIVLKHPDLAGVHFTGSTATFQQIWQTVGKQIQGYRNYPRLVGETGGKGFVVAHESADPQELATALVRGAFEYQGQKCSAASRAYIPDNLWPKVKEIMASQLAEIRMGDVEDFRNFINAVIDRHAFASIKGYLDFARCAKDANIILGGKCDSSVGWFIEPTVIATTNPHFKTMEEEIFGPVLTVYPYKASEFCQILELCDRTSPYALTGAVFARDRCVIEQVRAALTYAAGNFYINDKPTGAMVGQQPFGGGRASGTNDKAGSSLNLVRWVSPRTIKENFVPPTDYRYPFLAEK